MISDSVRRAGISMFVLAILLAQSYATFVPLWGEPVLGWYWPIVDYPMYSQKFEEGDPINVRHILAVGYADGTSRQVTPDDLGLNHWDYSNLTIGIVNGNPPGEDAIERVLKAASVYEEEPVAVTVADYPLIITRAGAVERVHAPKRRWGLR